LDDNDSRKDLLSLHTYCMRLELKYLNRVGYLFLKAIFFNNLQSLQCTFTCYNEVIFLDNWETEVIA